MIVCQDIDKKYDGVMILDKFSYRFPNNGMVLLFGESGSGKTTLLNTIAGGVGFDHGSIYINGNIFKNMVDQKLISDTINYSTQDTYFIDYLMVFDNLKLCSYDETRIDSLLYRFELYSAKYKYPEVLSGGERQRLSIIQALLLEKKILLLDEPTASLDKQNKIKVFEQCKAIKDEILIICASHDAVAKNYADEIIDFHSLKSDNILMPKEAEKVSKPVEKQRQNITKFMLKESKYPKKERMSSYIMGVVMFIAFICLGLADTTEHKLATNMEYVYGINQLYVETTITSEEEMVKLYEDKHVQEIVLDYMRTVPQGIDVSDPRNVTINVDYDVEARTLPYNKEAFVLSDSLAYGTYFNDIYQVILPHESLSNVLNPEQIIGKTIRMKMFDKEYEMEIVGVFKQWSEVERQYMVASGYSMANDKGYFINGEFSKRYIDAIPLYDDYGKRSYTIYYDSYKDMTNSYQKIKESQVGIEAYIYSLDHNIEEVFSIMPMLLLPIIAILVVITFLFYYQRKKIELKYKQHYISVFLNLGYSYKNIMSGWLFSKNVDLLKLLSITYGLSLVTMLVINALNRRIYFLPFQIFTFNISLIVFFVVGLLVMNQLLSFYVMKKHKYIGWYQLLIIQRDII